MFNGKMTDKIPGRSNGDVADDFYHHYKVQINILKITTFSFELIIIFLLTSNVI